ncbi:hypothetical protein LCGC14_0224670 [marine sediment metagenome]|uniref:Uncharacterized protein n=1 Tax=marine sediment metagenome TaxID=412755 RepID=A0A0F9XG62_9ZZZZ|nr:hypothetical protein [bacterium]
MTYIEKLKNAIYNKEGNQQAPKIITRVRTGYEDISTISARLGAIESWKERDANPTIIKNLASITENIEKLEKLKVEITTIHDKIIAARDEIKALPAQIENHLNTVVVPDLLTKMKVEIKGFVDRNVMPPITKMKDTFISVGDGVRNDVSVVANQGKKLSDTISTELNKMKNNFISFGTDIKEKTTALSDGIRGVATQMNDAVTEIKPAIIESANWARRIPNHARRLDFIAMGIDAFYSVAYLLYLTPPNAPAGAGAALPEMMEAYQQIGDAFDTLKTNFKSFGDTIKTKSTNIANQIEATGVNIDTDMDAFLSNFNKMFQNMSARINGGAGQVLKAIETAKKQAVVETAPKPQVIRVRGGRVIPVEPPPPAARMPQGAKPPIGVSPLTPKQQNEAKRAAQARAKAIAAKKARDKAAREKMLRDEKLREEQRRKQQQARIGRGVRR